MSTVIAWSTALVALIWAAETISSRTKRRRRSDVKRVHARLQMLSDIIPALFVIPAVAALLMDAGTLYLGPIAFLVQALGLAAAIAATVVGARARMEMGDHYARGLEVWSEQRLVTRGLFSFVRHPIYLGTIVLGLGLGLGTLSWPLVAIDLLLVLPWLHWLARQEERLMIERFGQIYRIYQARVPMLSPWPRPRESRPGVAERPDIAEQE